MKYLPILLLLASGCAAFDRVIETAQVVAPPIADVFAPGLGTTIGAIVGGVSVIGGGISTLILKKRKRKQGK